MKRTFRKKRSKSLKIEEFSKHHRCSAANPVGRRKSKSKYYEKGSRLNEDKVRGQERMQICLELIKSRRLKTETIRHTIGARRAMEDQMENIKDKENPDGRNRKQMAERILETPLGHARLDHNAINTTEYSIHH